MLDRFGTFAITIASINRSIQKIKSLEMKALNLKGTHVMCLYFLGKEPEGLTASQLCRLCGEDKAAISRTLSELSEKDYIHPAPSPSASSGKRGYRARIFLTEKGKSSIAYINHRVSHVLAIADPGLTDQQREDFYHTLALISDQLKAYIQAEKERQLS